MSKLGVVEDTLFVPMLGRIYASEHCPQILYDKKALELKNKLPLDLIKQNKQNQYTLLASASRSANMDRFIQSFLERRPNGVIVQLAVAWRQPITGCDNGRDTLVCCGSASCDRIPAGTAPGIGTRKPILQEMPFPKTWIRQVRTEFPDAPILVTAGGVVSLF